jgi:hypothetical protein
LRTRRRWQAWRGRSRTRWVKIVPPSAASGRRGATGVASRRRASAWTGTGPEAGTKCTHTSRSARRRGANDDARAGWSRRRAVLRFARQRIIERPSKVAVRRRGWNLLPHTNVAADRSARSVVGSRNSDELGVGIGRGRPCPCIWSNCWRVRATGTFLL